MKRNLELYKQLRSGRARFYPADFHVHSAASADVRLPSRFVNLSAKIQAHLAGIPLEKAKNLVDYESMVIEAFSPLSFYESLIDIRDKYLEEQKQKKETIGL